MTGVDVIRVLGIGGITACLLWIGYGIGWLVTRCLGTDDDAPR